MNLFDLPIPLDGECFEPLFKNGFVEIVSIVSGQVKDRKDFQDPKDEWVVLLKGEATLEMDGKKIHLKAGDYLFIEANKKHSLLDVAPGSLWLAVHIKKDK